MDEKRVKEKKVMPLDKKMYKVQNGKVVIESDELAKAIQDDGLDLFVDEEQAAAVADGVGFACPCLVDR